MKGNVYIQENRYKTLIQNENKLYCRLVGEDNEIFFACLNAKFLPFSLDSLLFERDEKRRRNES